jgi:5-methyltetrahydrofolate--homocysteine methyltransferase
VKACLGADVMMGHDPHCERWIARFREQAPPGTENEAGRGRRERGRRPARA